MPNFTDLKAAIKAKVVAQSTYFDSDAVFDYEPEIDNVTKEPWATVIPSGNDSEFGSTSENKRTYAFDVRIFVKRGDTRTNSEAEELVTSIINALINAFDQDYTLGGLALTTEAAPSAWGYAGESLEYRTAAIRIRAKVWFDVTT